MIQLVINTVKSRAENHDLIQLAINTVNSHPEGISHAQLVKCILETGHKHQGNLSADLMKVIRDLKRKGIIQKNLETREITPAYNLQTS